MLVFLFVTFSVSSFPHIEQKTENEEIHCRSQNTLPFFSLFTFLQVLHLYYLTCILGFCTEQFVITV